MKMTIVKSGLRRIVVLCGCVLVSGIIAAQTPPAKPGAAKSTNEAKLVDPAPVQSASAAEAATTPHDDSFVIGNDDVLSINVWKEPDVSRATIPVRSDGRISLPLAGEIQAAGLTPLGLERAIAAKLQSFISDPEVTVMVTQINSRKFNVLGQVTKPGAYPLTNSLTVLDAIALCGGFRDFAKKKAIYVLRQNSDGTQARIPFNYKEVLKGENPAQNIKLQPHDTIVVP
ncbi:MAG: polysaccharide biosynthesis/export family protein [Terriglobales bacterium]